MSFIGNSTKRTHSRGMRYLAGEDFTRIEPPRTRLGGPASSARVWDNTQTYEQGEVVHYYGKYYRALRKVTPPWFPVLASGDTPGDSDAWAEMSAAEAASIVGVDAVPQVGQVYADSDTVEAVQKALKAKGYGSYLGTSGPNKDGVDGKYGPSTAKAIRAMQAALGAGQTGVIDYGVLMALGVQAPSTTASTAVKAQVALDAATAAEHAQTPAEVLSAAEQLQAAMAMTGMPPAMQNAAQQVLAQAKTASTPEQVAKVKEQTQALALQVQPGWWSSPAWDGAPVVRWQGALAGAGLLAMGVGVYKMLWGKR